MSSGSIIEYVLGKEFAQSKYDFLGITINIHLFIVGNSLMIMASICLFRINSSVSFELSK